jgi:hypothetical protein
MFRSDERRPCGRKQQEQITEWEGRGAYPNFGDQTTLVRVAERRAFDIAVLAASILNEGAPRLRRLALSLAKTALESGPTAPRNVPLNILELLQNKVEELRKLWTGPRWPAWSGHRSGSPTGRIPGWP